PWLKTIVFERRLGTLAEKTERVIRLSRALAATFAADTVQVARAAELSRCDLLSEMVGEFPELQGIMGRYYAAHDGESMPVAVALEEFYQPRFAGDAIPSTAVGRCVAAADRVDTLVGIFAVGSAPSGDKDPFGLRRAALGCLRICIEGRVPLDLRHAVELAAAGYSLDIAPVLLDRVFEFMLDRSRAYITDRGSRADVLEAVLATRPTAPLAIVERVAALDEFLKLPEASALAAANKRIANILKKAGEVNAIFTLSHAVEPAERALATQLTEISQQVVPLIARGDHADYLTHLAQLRDPIDSFFDQVMVMVDDPDVRDNRLALLRQIHILFLRIADLSIISH
ncbi:MAG: glycine--tRNA ligase subunit beta, partial [Gammaproteobacteria bacterium]